MCVSCVCHVCVMCVSCVCHVCVMCVSCVCHVCVHVCIRVHMCLFVCVLLGLTLVEKHGGNIILGEILMRVTTLASW